MENPAQEVNRECSGKRVMKVLVDSQVLLVQLVFRVFLDLQVKREKTVMLVQWVHPVPLVLEVLKVLMVQMVHKVHLGLLALLAVLVRRENPVKLETQVHLEKLVSVALKAREEKREKLDLQELQDLLVRKVHQETTVLKEIPAPLVSQEILVLPENLVQVVKMVHLVTRVKMVNQANLDHPDHLEKLDHQVLLERGDLLDLPVQKADKERKVLRVKLVLKDPQERQGQLELRDQQENQVLKV